MHYAMGRIAASGTTGPRHWLAPRDGRPGSQPARAPHGSSCPRRPDAQHLDNRLVHRSGHTAACCLEAMARRPSPSPENDVHYLPAGLGLRPAAPPRDRPAVGHGEPRSPRQAPPLLRLEPATHRRPPRLQPHHRAPPADGLTPRLGDEPPTKKAGHPRPAHSVPLFSQTRSIGVVTGQGSRAVGLTAGHRQRTAPSSSIEVWSTHPNGHHATTQSFAGSAQHVATQPA